VIPLASPAAQYRARKDAIQSAITRVLDSGTYVLGGEVESFERAFADYCSVAHAVGVGSGTDALILALRGFGIGEGDEVISVSHTALATVAAIIATGATPVLIDVDKTSYTLDPSFIEVAIGPRTKAIVAVHLYGRPADLDAICAIAKRHGLKVVEDCAQAAGASYRSRPVGSIGDVGCFSFYPTKNLGAVGDGGMVTTSHAALAARVRRLRQYGWNETRETAEAGVNSRLDPLQAAILGAKLPHLDADNARRAAVAKRYEKGFAGLPLTLPAAANSAEHVYHLYVFGCDDRDALAAHLAKRGIDSGIHYPLPAHRHKGYAERVRIPEAGLPVTDRLVGRILSLPIYPELGDADVDRVVAEIRDFYRAP
jgi:dTDP-4-amino-4,6-dideoxygalactose transaminase